MFTQILYTVVHIFTNFTHFQNIANILGYLSSSVRLYLLTTCYILHQQSSASTADRNSCNLELSIGQFKPIKYE